MLRDFLHKPPPSAALAAAAIKNSFIGKPPSTPFASIWKKVVTIQKNRFGIA